MKKVILLAVFVLSCTLTFAQETKEPKKGWTKKGNISFLLNQSAFNNWTAGGINNVAGNLGLNYDFNYVNGDLTWDNKIIAAYGITKIKGSDQEKTDDRFEFNSLVGKKAKGYWYYSAFVNFKTQFDSGFDSSDTKTSHFFSPAYLQFGPGMLWKKSDNLKVNIAPATARFIFVHDHFTATGSSFGVEMGDTSRFEFGAAVGAYYKLNIMENVSMENILNLYTNYLEDPQNVDLDYTMNLVMKINKYLSANLAFQTIYDDNAFKGFQTREVFGLGVNYGF
ncbi:Protein of unknown function [Lutibacter oricola]|uniref:Outer membrane insertion C-terminal signal n=1 Tax=Lutibacter oricola TaxID=762486 RepID=A0A1H2RLP3_9FLAO|nr:DUF3078 domain-containing protein [Lutibacter oricola]SDW20287.1 Protein of unknown function [Lutibacter oricola]